MISYVSQKLSLVFFCCFILIILSFLGCNSDPELYDPTDAETALIVESSIGGYFLPMSYLEDDTVFDGASGVVVVNSDVVTITFTDYDWDADDSGTVNFVVNGSMVFSVSGDIITITFTDIHMVGIAPGTGDSIDATLSGTYILNFAAGTLNINLTISNLTDEPVDVVAVLDMVTGGGPVMISATINGYDHVTDFTDFLDAM